MILAVLAGVIAGGVATGLLEALGHVALPLPDGLIPEDLNDREALNAALAPVPDADRVPGTGARAGVWAVGGTGFAVRGGGGFAGAARAVCSGSVFGAGSCGLGALACLVGSLLLTGRCGKAG